jgi:predicted regulator of Ras-like GTPase activity (Roadblock/LC7/MglB family)
MATMKENLEQILKEARGENVESSAIITRDGLTITSDVSAGLDEEILAAMMATIYKAAEIAASRLKKSTAKRIITEFKDERAIITSIEPKALLVTIVKSKGDYELVCKKIDTTAEKIEKVFS